MDNPVYTVVKSAAEKLKKSGLHGKEWMFFGIPLLMSVGREVKRVEEEKESKIRLIKTKYDVEKEPYDRVIKDLGKIDKWLREQLLVEYDGVENIVTEDGEGEIVVRRPWVVEVSDPDQVPMEYWSVDSAKLKKAVDEGVRVIPGVSVTRGRALTVLTERKSEKS